MPPCYHSWELNRDASFFDMVIEVWQKVLGMDTTEKATCAWEQLRSIEHPPSTSNTHPKQVIGLTPSLPMGRAATLWCPASCF